MTLNELRYIVAVAQKRHFGHAAEACYVSQPTLSVAVKKLEEELGVGLFERGQGEVSLTAAGERIVTQAQRVLEEAGLIRQLASQSVNQLAGPLRVGAIHTVGPYLFPRLVPQLKQRASEMPLVIRENFTTVLTEQLKQGDLDVILISYPYDEPGIVTRPLYDESFSVLLPLKHPLADFESITVQQLQEENLLLLGDGHCFREQVKRICPGCVNKINGDANLQKNLEGGSLETIRCMVASGIGISVLPDTAIGEEYLRWDLLTTRPLAEESPKRRIGLAWRKSFPRPQAIDLLWESIRSCQLHGANPVAEPAQLAVG
ncbi:MAG: LysR family transcriptional regulator [gamma proteobacterium symbiont of Ctena orbiculata]|uniref:LysR family transcriptional regulator n=1 Tax=Candidatus Thiodiazotropha taylori TaxID=2792791 RepID=A0A944MDB0_9GAMM|nr:LysR family transcriptional regulator [Candidatus Thiodiazotropha taylori]PVV06531.1 MAG: LysR family transcriptional regulator [gamma proteobacterium symbiont of Ctena orbiculata]MBT2988905.1 LysR family transcriptional regulator [Candidatus Thiodiazotropha taylori]MBT2996449.1 LysR family transcriptional regulator [Candidatus Thiodiazotropha taylori]MBT3000117.1 LysR family transcriptional regulator [Candidatus Thiodiazotropha taylori]